jgi:poly-gamma-glutamate synthesis protein (capsule biosynthesis protein)
MPSPPVDVRAFELLLAGDVMTGRGIDQILPHPCPSVLYEPVVRDARHYVRLAEAAHGPVPRPVDFSYVWGDALEWLRRTQPDAKIVNLETSVTRSDAAWPGKLIHYRMHPKNLHCLTAAEIDCCVLANNHVLDWGHAGLIETLSTLDAAAVAHAGAGRTAAEAAAPAVLHVPDKGRILVSAVGAASSGIPPAWAAEGERPGIRLLKDLSESTAERVAAGVCQAKQPGDVAVVSIHWGGNWGYEIPKEHVRFAHRLIECGVDIVHGHSSHHVLGIESYRDRLILYGCGDLINDYEGIRGYESYRNDLAVLYLVRLEQAGRLDELRLVPFVTRRLQLRRAAEADATWLCELLNRLGRAFGTRFSLAADGSLAMER